jgi:hypothetical protein
MKENDFDLQPTELNETGKLHNPSSKANVKNDPKAPRSRPKKIAIYMEFDDSSFTSIDEKNKKAERNLREKEQSKSYRSAKPLNHETYEVEASVNTLNLIQSQRTHQKDVTRIPSGYSSTMDLLAQKATKQQSVKENWLENGLRAPKSPGSRPTSVSQHPSTHSEARPVSVSQRSSTQSGSRPASLAQHSSTHSETRPASLAQHSLTHSEARPASVSQRSSIQSGSRPASVSQRFSTHSGSRPSFTDLRPSTHSESRVASAGVETSTHVGSQALTRGQHQLSSLSGKKCGNCGSSFFISQSSSISIKICLKCLGKEKGISTCLTNRSHGFTTSFSTVINSEPSKTSLGTEKSSINSKTSSLPQSNVVSEFKEALEEASSHQEPSNDLVSQTISFSLSSEKESSLKETSFSQPESAFSPDLSLTLSGLKESKERSLTSPLPSNNPAMVLSLPSIVSEREISQEIINALSGVSHDDSETSYSSSHYRLESTVLVAQRNTEINSTKVSGPHVAFESFAGSGSKQDKIGEVIETESRIQAENADEKSIPEEEKTGSYSKKYQKIKYEIEMQNFWIDKMNRDLKWKIQQKRPESEIQRLEKKVGIEIQKVNEMVEFAEALRRGNPTERWGSIPLTPFAKENMGKSIGERVLAPPMVPSDTSNLTGFERLNEIKTDRDDEVNWLQNEIESKEDRIKELSEKLKQAEQSLMELSEKRESLSQSPSESSITETKLKQMERDSIRKTKNEEELIKNIEAIRSVDEMMKILMDKIQSIKEVANTLQEEIDWLRMKNFEIMDRELYLKENL